ncbi:MAG: ricin-type beta-trefoil lectin domain protein [Candidatus Nanopelagicales bacterium]
MATQPLLMLRSIRLTIALIVIAALCATLLMDVPSRATETAQAAAEASSNAEATPQAEPAPATAPAPAPSKLAAAWRKGKRTRANDLPAFHAHLAQLAPVRTGGFGVMEAKILRQKTPGARNLKTRNVRIAVKLPKGLDVSKVRAGGWKCRTPGRTAICQTRSNKVLARKLSPRELPMRIKTKGNKAKRLANRDARVTYTTSWQQFRGGKWMTTKIKSTSKLKVEPRLGLRVASASGPVMVGVRSDGDASVRRLNLTAEVINTHNDQVVGVWTQTKGPKVTFLNSEGRSVGKVRSRTPITKEGGQTVVIPKRVKKPTKFTFKLVVKQRGAAVTKKVNVRVIPQVLGQFDPNTDQSINNLLDQATASSTAARTEGLATRTSAFRDGTIAGPTVLRTGTSARTTVGYTPGKSEVKSVEWSVASGQQGLLESASTDGFAMSFAAPPNAGEAVVLVARATLADGAVVERSKIVVVDPTIENNSVKYLPAGYVSSPGANQQQFGVQNASNTATPDAESADVNEGPADPTDSATASPSEPADESPSPSDSGSTPAEPSEAPSVEPSPTESERPIKPNAVPSTPSEIAFCNLVSTLSTATTDTTIAAKFGSVLTLKQATTTIPAAPATCLSPNAAITFTGALLAHAGSEFRAVKGKITLDGITLSDGDFAIPTPWQQYLPGVSVLPLKTLQGEPIVIPLTDGVWDSVAGKFVVSGRGFNLEWLPLPGGWNFADDGFTLTLATVNIPNPALPTPSPSGTTTPEPTPTGTEPARVDVATILVEQLAEANPASGTGSVLFNVGIINGEANQINVEVAGIGVYEAANGSQLQASGSGTINVNERTGSVRVGLDCMTDGEPSEEACQLVDGFFMRSGELTWSNEVGNAGISFAADFEIRTGAPDVGENDSNYQGEKTYQFSGSGRFASTTDWDLTVSSETPWQVSKNITLAGLSGSIGMTPTETAQGAASSKFLIDLRGRMDNSSMGERVTVNSVSASVTNMCSEENVASGICAVGELRIDVVINGTLAFNNKPAKTFQASATFNITTMKFVASASLSKIKFGPENMQITDVGLTLTNTASNSGACRAKDSPNPTTPAPSGWALAIQARGKAFGLTLDFGGQITLDREYCVWATPAQTVNVADDVNVQDATFAYTSYAQGATVHVPQLGTGPDTPAKQIDVPAGKFKLSGSFELQDDVASQIDDDPNSKTVGAKVEIEALLNSNLTGFEATVKYVVGKPIYFTGSANETHLSMQSVSLRMAVNTTGIAMSFAIGLNFHTIAGPDPVEQPASDTPLYGEIEVAFSTTKGPELSLKVGVDVNNGPVQNAFGQTGLTLKALSVAATLSAQPSFSFAGSASFPTDWVEKVELREGATISIGFVVSYTAPCIAFQLNGKKANDGINVYETGFDLAGMGFLTARQFSFMIAPQECKLPLGPGTWYTMPAGFGFWFDGAILGAPVTVGFNVKLPSPSSPGFAVKAKLQIPALAIPGVTLSGATGKDSPVLVDLDIDTAERRYYGKIDASIEIGIGSSFTLASVKIFAEFDYDPTQKNLKLKFTGSSKINFYVVRSQMSVDFTLKVESGTLKEFGVFADFDARIIGQRMYGGVGLYYNGDKLMTFNVYGGMSLWIIIGRFSGNFDINYCRGKLTKPEKGPATCNMDATSKSTQFLVRLYGDIKIFGFKKDFSWKVVDKETYDDAEVDGEIPFATDLSMTQEGLMRLADSKGIRDANGTKQGYAAKVTGPAPQEITYGGRTIKPCENMNSTLRFDPNNPEGDPIASVVPQPGTCMMRGYLGIQNADGQGGIDLNDSSRFSKVEKVDFVCDTRGCAQFTPGMSERYAFYGFWTAGAGDSEPTGTLPTNINEGLSSQHRISAQQAFFFAPGDTAIRAGQMPNGYEIRSTGTYRYSMLSSPNTNCKLWVEAGNKTNELISTCRNSRGNQVVMWQTGNGSDSAEGNYATMQADGNFVFYRADGRAIWASGTFGSGYFVYLSDNGALQVRNRDGQVLWAATTKNTNGGGVYGTSWAPGRIVNIVTSRDMCLDSGGAAVGVGVKIWECNGTGAQRWQIVGDTTVKSVATGLCLSVPNDGWESGTQIQYANCDSSLDGQQWAGYASDNSFRNIGSGLCTDVPDNSNANGVIVQIFDCKPGNPAQKFKARDVLEREKAISLVHMAGRCLDLGSGASAIYNCNGTGAQKFTITSNDQLRNNDGRCLAPAGNGTGDGTRLILVPCSGNTSLQKWRIDKGRVKNQGANRCLDVDDNRNANNVAVQLYSCKDNDAQKWGYRY